MSRTITVDQFHDELKAQGVSSHMDFAFRCPMCRTIQSARDLIAAGAGPDFDSIEKYLAFSCVGRFTKAGEHKRGTPPGKGCNWTLGGLFQIHELTVLLEDEEKCPRFDPATPEEAKSHAAKHVEATPELTAASPAPIPD